MSRNDTPAPHPGQDRDDALLKRYLEASALDPARPSPALRKAVLAQAHAAAAGFANAPGEAPVRSEKSTELIAVYDRPTLGNGQNSSESSVFQPPRARSAANDTSWHVRAVASLAVLGLATLLFLQFESGTPDEREVATGQSPPAAAAPAAQPVQAPSPSGGADPAPSAESHTPMTTAAPEPSESPELARTPTPPTQRKAAAADKARSESVAPELAAPAGSTLGAMKTMPAPAAAPPTPAPMPEAALAKSMPPVAPAAAPIVTLAPPSQEARSRLQPVPAPATGRNADATRMRQEASASAPASQRLLVAVANGALEAARQALKDGAPVNAPDAAGQTPLMLAARRGDEAMLRLLLAMGADPTRTDAAGLTAAEHARRAGHEMLRPLLNSPESPQPAPQR